jgi:hypothetical protein
VGGAVQGSDLLLKKLMSWFPHVPQCWFGELGTRGWGVYAIRDFAPGVDGCHHRRCAHCHHCLLLPPLPLLLLLLPLPLLLLPLPLLLLLLLLRQALQHPAAG